MNATRRLISLSCLAAIAAGCAYDQQAKKLDKPVSAQVRNESPIIHPPHGGTQILVTFADERVGRVPLGNVTEQYRKRGSYSNSAWSSQIAEQLAQSYALEQIAQWPITTLGIHCVIYEIPKGQPVDQILERLSKDRRVEAVQTMKQFQVLAESYSDPYYRLQVGLRSMNVSEVHKVSTGKNVKIAVIDTGVDDRHPDLAGQLSESKDLVPGSSGGNDDIHGTAVAGIIAASANNGRGIVGVAPGAKIIALKACWQESPQKPEAVCNSFTLALALNTAIEAKPQILNMSLSGPSDPLLQRMIDKAVQEGIIVVASEPSSLGRDNDFPASMNQVIAVRSDQGQGAGMPAARKAVAAPGSEVLTTLPHDTYNFMSGSSFAAAHVSGLIALMKELKPSLTAQQAVVGLSRSMSHPLGSSGPAVIDACAAIASVGAPAAACSAAPLHLGDASQASGGGLEPPRQ